MPRTGWLSRDAAVVLADTRLENARRVALLPSLQRGMRYASSLRGDSWPVKVWHERGQAFAYRIGATWHVVDVASGVAFASFGQRAAAAALVDALGDRVDEYFARAGTGDVRAATAIGRLCRVHLSRLRHAT